MLTPLYTDTSSAISHARAEDWLPTVPDASVQLVLVDPPFFRYKLDYNGEKVQWDRQWKSEAAYLDWLRWLCSEWRRVLTPNGSLYCFASPQMAWAVEGVIREQFHVLNQVVWVKIHGNTSQRIDKEELRGFLHNTERLIFAEPLGSDASANHLAGYEDACDALHKKVYAPIGDYIRTERERAGWTRGAVEVALGYVSSTDPTRGTALCYRWEEGSSLPTKEAYERLRALLNNGHVKYLRQEYEDLRQEYEYLRQEYEYLRQEYEDLRQEYEDLRRPFFLTAQTQYTDVWTFAPVKPGKDKHPCEKSLPLLEHIISASSRPGDTVLDCCAGSFSTLEAAKRLGRRGIGCEQELRWCEVGARRLQQVLPLRWDARAANTAPIQLEMAP